MSNLVSTPGYKLTALLHDAPEAYCGDVVRPLKQSLVSFKMIEAGIWTAVAAHFGLPNRMPEEVCIEDARALLMEKRDLLEHHEHQWEFPQCAYPDLEIPDEVIVPLSPVESRQLFLDIYAKLSSGRVVHSSAATAC